jgi:YidC/Oxa1 family membrane protein insertase
LAEISNPNQSGGGKQDSSSMLIFALVFAMMFLGMKFFGPKKAEQPSTKQPAVAGQRQSAASRPEPVTPSTPASAVTAHAEQAITVENELYRIQFSNRGAVVTSWILKKWKNDEGKPLDLVSTAAPKAGYPLSLYTYDANLRNQLDQALYVPSATGALQPPATLTFTYSNGAVAAKKTFQFGAGYVVHAEASVTSNGASVPAMLAWPSGLGDQVTLPQFAAAQLDVSQNGKFDRTAPKKVSNGLTLNGPFDYAGISDQYFGAIFLPDSPVNATVVSLNQNLPIARDPRRGGAANESAPVLGLGMGSQSGPTAMRIFAGPKQIDVLNSVRATADNGTQTGPSIQPILHFGWSGVVARPLFSVLRWTHDRVVHNWGWAILLLTFIIYMAMLPTRIQMMKSALKMQRIQPEMQQIKEKYKKYKATDPRRQDMNKEIMALQQREGVNMFGGCLPMLIQYPLLYGFYSMLANVIELRQAHWGWLHDLAAPDPLHILPVFVIVSMFLVQYLSPSPGMDPAQQKMMAFMMPVFFGFIMWNVGAGLALYWAGGNVINTVQQLVMNRTGMGKQMREIALKRAAKKLGKPAAARR